MSIAKEIAPHLPYLRRFARALSGTQASGDAHVVAMLEALVADPSGFPRDVDPRIGLYRTFLKLWSSTGVDMSEPVIELGRAPAERNLDALTPRPRQAFLLRTVEGFSIDEVGTIMNVPADEAATLIQTAGQEIAEQVATDVLIIEDILDSGLTLKYLMKNLRSRRPASLEIAAFLGWNAVQVLKLTDVICRHPTILSCCSVAGHATLIIPAKKAIHVKLDEVL